VRTIDKSVTYSAANKILTIRDKSNKQIAHVINRERAINKRRFYVDSEKYLLRDNDSFRAFLGGISSATLI
jgi:hypothetical protein